MLHCISFPQNSRTRDPNGTKHVPRGSCGCLCWVPCVGSAGGEDTGHLACNLKQLVGLTASNMAAGIHPPSRAPRHPTGVGEHFWVYFGD